MNMHEEYKQKLVSAEQAAALVRSGDWIDYGWCVGTPVAIDKALARHMPELSDVKIRGGVLKPGEWLKENDLADELLVSRTPVREAIRKLEQEGYVVTVPRRGAYVASVSIRDINEIFEIRAALEALACELAAERITDEEQERLERLLVGIGRAIEEHDMERIVRTDIEFHELLYQAARNERLLIIIGNLREQLTRLFLRATKSEKE